MAIQTQKALITPMAFAESMYQLNGKPLRFGVGRNYLKVIHEASIRLGLLMTGRQVEKSSTVSIKIANNVLLRPFSRSLYVAPMNEQVKTFSRGRLDKLFRYSQNNLVARRYKDSKLTDQVFHKEFSNGAEIYMRNCFEEADNIRGLSIDDIFIDEVQDIIVEALPVIMETQTRSQDKHTFYTGTPKTFANTIQQQWDVSSQADWVIRCPHCLKEQVLGVENVAPTYFKCRSTKCGRPIPDINRAFGRWEHRNPNARMKGFRITQMMIPDIDVDSIYEKIQTYPVNRLYNEVLGRSYEQADKPFTDKLLNDMTDNELSTYTRTAGISGPFANRFTFLGIDWGEGEKSGKQGTGYTVMTVGAMNEDGKFQVLHTKRFERGDELDPDYQLRYAMNLISAFNIKMAVGDYGGGVKENIRLRKMLGQRFIQCQYVGMQKKSYVYDESDFKMKIPRSPWMTELIEFCHELGVLFPGANNDDLGWMFSNLKGIYSEYRSSKTGRSEELFYGHPISEPDDFFHSLLYCWLGYKIVTNNMLRATEVTPVPTGRSMFTGAYGA